MNPKLKFLLPEVCIRAALLGVTLFLTQQQGIEPVVPPEEWWRYKQQSKPCLFHSSHFVGVGILLPTLVLAIFYKINRNKPDLAHGLLAVSLGICLTAAITALMKVTISRPRPNFFLCCYPDGQIRNKCTGDPALVESGHKSFPSGHASFAFVNMTFLFLYLSGKLNLFNELGLGQSWRICVCMAPVITAVMAAILRTTKNQHHPEDVIAGALLGSFIAFICYRQHFPSIYAPNPGQSYEFKDDPFDNNSR